MTSPPFFDHAVPERACSRAVNERGDACGKEAFLHVAWADTPDGIEGGWVCTEHARELSQWPPLVIDGVQQTHEPTPDCGMPGSRWFFDENTCRCPDEDEVQQPVEAVGVFVAAGGVSPGE